MAISRRCPVSIWDAFSPPRGIGYAAFSYPFWLARLRGAATLLPWECSRKWRARGGVLFEKPTLLSHSERVIGEKHDATARARAERIDFAAACSCKKQ